MGIFCEDTTFREHPVKWAREKAEDLWDTITYCPHKLVRFFVNTKRALAFVPTIYRCSVYDYNSIYYVLQRQLEDIRRALIEDQYHTHSKKDLRRLSVCIELCGRLATEDRARCKEFYDVLHEEWQYVRRTKLDSGGAILSFDEIPVALRKKSDYLRKKHEKLDEYEKEMLFSYLNKYTEHWWC